MKINKATLNQEIENFGEILKEEQLFSRHLNTTHQLLLEVVTVETSFSC